MEFADHIRRNDEIIRKTKSSFWDTELCIKKVEAILSHLYNATEILCALILMFFFHIFK